MADPGKPPLSLDEAQIERFLDDEAAPFLERLKSQLTETVDGVLPLPYHKPEGPKDTSDPIYGTDKPFAIGHMLVGNDVFQSGHLVKSVTEMIQEVEGILNDQVSVFMEIRDSLRITVNDLLKEQGDSLEKIEGEKLLDLLDEVDVLLSGQGGE